MRIIIALLLTTNVVFDLWHSLGALAAVEISSDLLSQLQPTPILVSSSSNETSSSLSKIATFSCQVLNPAQFVVSWLKIRPLELISVGDLKYNDEGRFEVINTMSIDVKSQTEALISELRILRVEIEDEGSYQCQLNSRPTQRRNFRLNVTVPSAELMNTKDPLYVNADSKLNLTCVVNSAELPHHIFWAKDEKIILEGDLGKSRFAIFRNGRNTSLIIDSTIVEDSGQYECRPSNVDQWASVVVHVVQEDTADALHTTHDGAGSFHREKLPLFIAALTTISMAIFDLLSKSILMDYH